MPEDLRVGRTRLSAPEFLAALEKSGALAEGKWREVRDRLGRKATHGDSLVLAQQLIEDGTITPFQARRLLKGKQGLNFGRYVLLDHIGQGARGRVFKARHKLMDRVVAVKVLVPETFLSKKAVSRFFREMKIVGLLDHAHVVRAVDADVHEGCPYIVMEYLEGEDLEQIFARRGPLPPDEVIAYIAQASRGLAHAHERGVIHRDVKPTNIFLVKTGSVKLLDLGFGALIGQSGKAGNVFDTDEGIVVGTTDFMSPEQVKDRPIDARSDLFSLGCTMYRLLTGAYAFPGITREDRLIKRMRQVHVPIADVRPGLSDGLVAVVDQLLAIEPDDRFSSATTVAEALEALLIPAVGSQLATDATKATGKSVAPDARPVAAEPEPQLDWSMIESALRPKGHGAREATLRVSPNKPQPPSAKGISSHRKVLEAEGIESGREVHEKYRHELIEMKKAMTELRATEPTDQAPAAVENWLERLGEWFGDFLAEPSAAQIVIGILGVFLLLAVALSIAIG